jgi:hypothetical protein
MRDIEFRGKRKDTGEWVYGDLYQGERTQIFLRSPSYFLPVSLETVGQYAGLRDKNGVKIFEGDWIKDDENRIFLIDWNNSFLGWLADGGSEGVLLSDLNDGYYIEVIGNIHDNPELLEEVQ